MSHFVQIKTIIKERELLIEAIKDLNLEYQTGDNLFVESYENTQVNVDIKIITGSKYEIGFRKTENGYDIVADWWAIETFTRIREKDFIQKITKQYSYNVIKDQIHQQNMVIEREETLENGDTVLIVSERS
ncbi:MAG: DUF1257 domain-containing protein [Verrucomicrobiia bacterium]